MSHEEQMHLHLASCGSSFAALATERQLRGDHVAEGRS